MATLRNKLKRIQPAYFAGDLMAAAKGELKTFAVHLEYDINNMDYIILKVEPWNAYAHINGDYSMIYQVAERDELGAYNKMRNYIDRLKEEEEL